MKMLDIIINKQVCYFEYLMLIHDIYFSLGPLKSLYAFHSWQIIPAVLG